MARVCPAPERTLLGGLLGQHTKVEVQNGSGTWIDLTDLEGINWVDSWSIDESVDQNVASLVLTLRANHGALSLHPLRTDSDLNVDDTLAYSPLVYGGRRVRVYTGASIPDATAPSTPWRMVFDGVIDEPGAQENGETLVVQGRDLGALLLDFFPEEQRFYSTEAGLPLEEVMQHILDDTGMSVTLTTPTGLPPRAIKRFLYDGTISVGEELRTLAQQIGWEVRYRWVEDNPDVNAIALALYDPGRDNVTPAFTVPPSEYLTVDEFKFGDRNVRNVIGISFYNSLTGGALDYLEVQDDDSIAIYGGEPQGRRYMALSETATSEIDTPTEAQAMIEAVLSDLSTPFADHVITSYDLWFAQLGDLLEFPPNSVHYDEEQNFAIVSFRREWSQGKGLITIRTRGKPAGAYLDWIRKQGKGPAEPQGIPAPVFTYLLGEESHGGGVTGDGMVWIGFQFEVNTQYIEIWGEEGEDDRTPTPDIANNSSALRLFRQEGVDSSAPNWASLVGIATRPLRWRKIRACGFGYQGQKGQDWIPPAVQAIDPTPLPTDGTISAFSVTSGQLDTNIIAVTPGSIDPAGGNWIIIRRDGVDIIPVFIDASTAQVFISDVGINPHADYTYEGFIWNNGVSGPHRRHGSGIPALPSITWESETPRLVFSAGQYLTWLDWSITGIPGAHRVVIEVGTDGMNFTDLDSVLVSAGSSLFTTLTSRLWYRLRVEDNTVPLFLAYSAPRFFAGHHVPPSQGSGTVPTWNPVPTARILKSDTVSIGVPTLVIGHITPTSGAVETVLQSAPDVAGSPGTWTDTAFRSAQLAGEEWNLGPGIGPTWYRLSARDATDTSMALSTEEFWPGFV